MRIAHPGPRNCCFEPAYALGDGDGEAESESDGDGEALELFFAVEDFFFALAAGDALDDDFAVVDVFLVVEADVDVVVVASLFAHAAINATAAITAMVETMDFFIGGNEVG